MTKDPNDPNLPRVRPRRHSGLTDLIHQDRALGRPLAGTIRADETEFDTGDAETWEIEQGTDVLCRDGQKVGEVVDVRPGYLVVEQGFYDPRDIFVPLGYITRHDDASLTLSLTQEEFDRRDWTREPGTDRPAEDEARD